MGRKNGKLDNQQHSQSSPQCRSGEDTAVPLAWTPQLGPITSVSCLLLLTNRCCYGCHQHLDGGHPGLCTISSLFKGSGGGPAQAGWSRQLAVGCQDLQGLETDSRGVGLWLPLSLLLWVSFYLVFF